MLFYCLPLSFLGLFIRLFSDLIVEIAQIFFEGGKFNWFSMFFSFLISFRFFNVAILINTNLFQINKLIFKFVFLPPQVSTSFLLSVARFPFHATTNLFYTIFSSFSLWIFFICVTLWIIQFCMLFCYSDRIFHFLQTDWKIRLMTLLFILRY